jgi:hypothetical protein
MTEHHWGDERDRPDVCEMCGRPWHRGSTVPAPRGTGSTPAGRARARAIYEQAMADRRAQESDR